MLVKLYYQIKPFIPRRAQIAIRRFVVRQQRPRFENVWPIDQQVVKHKPGNWKGWPDGKRFALVITHDVETGKGVDRCLALASLDQEAEIRSSFNFVPLRYTTPESLRNQLTSAGFEVGVHGLYHDGKYYNSRQIFRERCVLINRYLKEWRAVGFRSPSMLHKLEWLHDLDILYDASTFDTDPFEPQPEGVGRIYPYWVRNETNGRGYVELPYTLPQDFTVFVLFRERTIDIWKRKLDWIASEGGMVLLNVHPDYIHFGDGAPGMEEYPAQRYVEFLKYLQERYEGQYWNMLPRELAEWVAKAQGHSGQAGKL